MWGSWIEHYPTSRHDREKGGTPASPDFESILEVRMMPRRQTHPGRLLLVSSVLVLVGVAFAQDQPPSNTGSHSTGSQNTGSQSQETIYSPGRNGVTIPRAIHQPPPEYSEKARRKKLEGTVMLSLVVTPDGNTTDIKVTSPLGSGLDEKAIEAVRQWKFEPATKDGKPVAVKVAVEVSFHLYK
jgi:TonB family protein